MSSPATIEITVKTAGESQSMSGHAALVIVLDDRDDQVEAKLALILPRALSLALHQVMMRAHGTVAMEAQALVAQLDPLANGGSAPSLN